MTIRKRLAAILTAVALAITAPLLGAGTAAADPGPAATGWAGKGEPVLVLTNTPTANGNAAAAAGQISCGVLVGDFDPVEMGAGASVECRDELGNYAFVPRITITIFLAVDDGTARGPSSSSSGFNVPIHFEDVFLPTCFPDGIGVIADVTVVFPTNTASGRFFSGRLTRLTC